MISTSLDEWLRLSSSSQPKTRIMMRYRRRRDTSRDHASGWPSGQTTGQTLCRVLKRYTRRRHRPLRPGHRRPQAAEIAVTIVDDWQGRGLGTELLSQLTDRAQQEGIRCFTALVAEDNKTIAGLLRNVSACLVGRGPGTV